MGIARAIESTKKLTEAGGPLDYGPQRSRLVVRVQRALAQGHPVTAEQVTRFAAEIGIAPHEADAFLQTVTERDEDDNIVGAFALSLNEHPHRFVVDGTRRSAWCAADTLFLPAVLDRTAIVESPSPVSGRTVRLRVSPRGWGNGADAVDANALPSATAPLADGAFARAVKRAGLRCSAVPGSRSRRSRRCPGTPTSASPSTSRLTSTWSTRTAPWRRWRKASPRRRRTVDNSQRNQTRVVVLRPTGRHGRHRAALRAMTGPSRSRAGTRACTSRGAELTRTHWPSRSRSPQAQP